MREAREVIKLGQLIEEVCHNTCKNKIEEDWRSERRKEISDMDEE